MTLAMVMGSHLSYNATAPKVRQKFNVISNDLLLFALSGRSKRSDFAQKGLQGDQQSFSSIFQLLQLLYNFNTKYQRYVEREYPNRSMSPQMV